VKTGWVYLAFPVWVTQLTCENRLGLFGFPGVGCSAYAQKTADSLLNAGFTFTQVRQKTQSDLCVALCATMQALFKWGGFLEVRKPSNPTAGQSQTASCFLAGKLSNPTTGQSQTASCFLAGKPSKPTTGQSQTASCFLAGKLSNPTAGQSQTASCFLAGKLSNPTAG